MSGKSNIEDVSVELIHSTEKAWLVTDGRVVGGKRVEIWVPKSQCELQKDGNVYTLTAPEWLLKDKGLI